MSDHTSGTVPMHLHPARGCRLECVHDVIYRSSGDPIGWGELGFCHIVLQDAACGLTLFLTHSCSMVYRQTCRSAVSLGCFKCYGVCECMHAHSIIV